MMKSPLESQGIPMAMFIDELEKRIKAHNQKAAAFSGPPLENLTEDLMRTLRKRGEVKLSEVEDSESGIEAYTKEIRYLFLIVSKDIEYHRYDIQANCCPTVLSILSQYWLPS
jgi:hypothetical protein